MSRAGQARRLNERHGLPKYYMWETEQSYFEDDPLVNQFELVGVKTQMLAVAMAEAHALFYGLSVDVLVEHFDPVDVRRKRSGVCRFRFVHEGQLMRRKLVKRVLYI